MTTYIAVRPIKFLDHSFTPGQEIPNLLVDGNPNLRTLAKMPHHIYTNTGGELPSYVATLIKSHGAVHDAKVEAEEAALKQEAETLPVEKAETLAFKPYNKTVPEVLDFIERNPQHKEAILALEASGRKRAAILGQEPSE